MIKNAGIANRFNRKGGALYTVPNSNPNEYNDPIKVPK